MQKLMAEGPTLLTVFHVLLAPLVVVTEEGAVRRSDIVSVSDLNGVLWTMQDDWMTAESYHWQ